MASKAHIQNLKYGQKVARNSMFILIGLTIIKAYGGYISNAVSLLGDAASSFADMIGMIAIYIGLTLSLRPPSKRFRYGYHRIETFISLVIAGMTSYFGYKILRESIARLANDTQAEPDLAFVGIAAAFISIGVSIFAYVYQQKIALKINSQALLASSKDKRNDAFVSSGVLIGLVTNIVGIPSLEKFIGIGISLLVLFTGLKEVRDSLLYLFDYWDEPNITEKVRRIIKDSKIVTGIKNIRLRHAGTFIFGEAFLEINPFTDINDLRDEIHRLERIVDRKIPHLGDFVFYVDPPKPQKMVIALPVKNTNGLESELACTEETPFYFLLAEIRGKKIVSFSVSKETYYFREAAKITKFLKDHRVNIFISSHVQTLLFYPLRLANIRIYPQFTNVTDAKHTLKLLLLEF